MAKILDDSQARAIARIIFGAQRRRLAAEAAEAESDEQQTGSVATV